MVVFLDLLKSLVDVGRHQIVNIVIYKHTPQMGNSGECLGCRSFNHPNPNLKARYHAKRHKTITLTPNTRLHPTLASSNQTLAAPIRRYFGVTLGNLQHSIFDGPSGRSATHRHVPECVGVVFGIPRSSNSSILADASRGKHNPIRWLKE